MDDNISRKQMIDALRDYLVGKRCPDDGTLTCRLIENEVINKLPTIHTKHGTNLAEVGTNCISRQSAIDICDHAIDSFKGQFGAGVLNVIRESIAELPPAEPDKDKVSDLLYHIYSIESPHLDMNGVIAKKYYCEELWKELFGKESELPRWMT